MIAAGIEIGEIMGMADIGEAIGEMVSGPTIEELDIETDEIFGVTDTSTTTTPELRPTPIQEGVGLAGIGQGIVLPGEINAFRYRHPYSMGYRNIGRPNPTSFKEMPRTTRKGKAKRKSYRTGPYGRRSARRISTGIRAGVSSSVLATASRHKGKNVIIKKLARGPNPTTQEGGGSLTHFLRNGLGKTSPNGNFGFSYNFQLSQFPNYTQYTAIYQWYKILWVKLHFYPLNNSHPSLIEGDATNPIKGSVNTGTAPWSSLAPQLIVAPDHQSEALFGSEGEAMEHDGAIHHVFNDGNEFSVYLSPKPTGLVGSAGSEVTYLTPAAKWITTSSATVPHYGLRCFAYMNDGTNVKVVMEMKVAFRGNKQ